MENGGRERDRGSESDEDDDSQQNTSDTGGGGGSRSYIQNTAKETPVQSVRVTSLPGPGWTADFRDSKGTAASQTPAGWDSSPGSGGQTQETGWANFTEFQPFSG